MDNQVFISSIFKDESKESKRIELYVSLLHNLFKSVKYIKDFSLPPSLFPRPSISEEFSLEMKTGILECIQVSIPLLVEEKNFSSLPSVFACRAEW